MDALYKLLILFGITLCADGNNNTVPSTVIRYKICYDTSKLCLYCKQEAGVLIYTKPFTQENYWLPMWDTLNRERSKYAMAKNISNMKFTKWSNEFEAMTGELVSYNKPVVECNDLNGNEFTKKKYTFLEYKSQVNVTLKNLSQAVKEQFDRLTDEFIVDPVMMTYNLNEFGCAYSYDKESFKLIAIMRCLGYVENRLGGTELTLGKLCDGCDHSNERCIELDWYKGLCVYNHFNETRLRLRIEPEVQLGWIMPYQLMFRVSIYVLNVIVLFVIVYVVYAACVICRHNRLFDIRNDRTIESVMPMVENIYNRV